MGQISVSLLLSTALKILNFSHIHLTRSVEVWRKHKISQESTVLVCKEWSQCLIAVPISNPYKGFSLLWLQKNVINLWFLISNCCLPPMYQCIQWSNANQDSQKHQPLYIHQYLRNKTGWWQQRISEQSPIRSIQTASVLSSTDLHLQHIMYGFLQLIEK